MIKSNKKRLTYNSRGTLRGHVPTGHCVRVKHLEHGQSGYEVWWDGQWHRWLRAVFVKDKFGIQVQVKKSGNQEGYPSEAVTRAVWRHLMDGYNNFDPEVEYDA